MKNLAILSFSLFLLVACGQPPQPDQNQAPSIEIGANQTVSVGQLVKLQAQAKDPENKPLSYQWRFLQKPEGSKCTLTTTKAQANFLPDQVGRYTLELEVNDGQLSSKDSLVITATLTTPSNKVPTISKIAPQHSLGQKISVPFTVSDEQPEDLLFKATSSDQALVKNSKIQVLGSGQNRTLNIQPETAATGRLNINLSVQDSSGLNGKTSFSLALASKLSFPHSVNYAQFGKAVDLSDNYAVVGASGTDVNGSSSGSAYIFERTNQNSRSWSQAIQLQGSDTAAYDNFGAAVAISGNSAIIGAPHSDPSGAAYVFKRTGNTWTQQAKLKAPDPQKIDRFGNAVAISGDYAIVGAWSKREQSAAYIFKRTGNTWTQQAKLMPSNNDQTLFGRSVAIFNDYAIVGATRDSQKARDAGAAYIFKRTGEMWAQHAKLAGSDIQEGEGFGNAVALSDKYAIIAASQHKHNGPLSGAAYLYQRIGDTWIEKSKLTAQDKHKGLFFGKSVAISGETAIIGANGLNDAGLETGATYIFKRSDQGWKQQSKLVAVDAEAYDSFGSAVALSATEILVGASFHDQNKVTTGTAYIFPR